MENKTVLYSVFFLIIGLGLGWFIAKGTTQQMPVGFHEMPNGQVMMNNGMDMNDMMGSMMSGLNGKTGDAFDAAFIDEMILHHEGAVEMAEAALKNAKHQEIKDMATAIISAQTKEIEQMKQWRTIWYQK